MRLRRSRARSGIRTLAAAGLFLLAGVPAHAAEKTGCSAFLWPVAKEQAAFAKADLAVVEAGAARGAWGEQAFALKLRPQAEAALPKPPSGAPHGKIEKPYAGTVSFEAPAEAGAYHVTLSAPAWIDSRTVSSSLSAVSMTTRAVGQRALMARVASAPVPSGSL